MNFLAHIYLSGDNDLVSIGNFMADGIRGKEFESHHAEIQKGVLLHRAIDTFTDSHELFRRGTKRLHPRYHHYAGVILDVFYDHFLAKNWNIYSNEPLADFAARFYRLLSDNERLLTDRTKNLLPVMMRHNWLLAYATVEGISQILTQMDTRTGNQSGMRTSSEELVEFYPIFEEEFTLFFEDIRVMAAQKLKTL